MVDKLFEKVRLCKTPLVPVPLNNALDPAENPGYVEDTEAVLLIQPLVAFELTQPVGSVVPVPKVSFKSTVWEKI